MNNHYFCINKNICDTYELYIKLHYAWHTEFIKIVAFVIV
jgi:hypothetical protein